MVLYDAAVQVVGWTLLGVEKCCIAIAPAACDVAVHSMGCSYVFYVLAGI